MPFRSGTMAYYLTAYALNVVPSFDRYSL